MSNTTQNVVKYFNDLNNEVIFYFGIVSSAIGLPTNLISAWIFYRIMKKNKTNMGFLCLIQSLVDFLYLLLLFLVIRPTPLLFKHNVFNSSNFLCKILMFIRRFISHASCVITVTITLDRFLAVCHPNLATMYMKRKSVLFGLISGFLLLMVFADSPNLFFFLSYQNGSSPACTADPDVILAADLIAIIFRTYLPFVVMTLMNFFIIRKMKTSSRVRSKQVKNQNHKENHFTYAVIAYDAFFLLCSLPLAIFYIVYDFFSISGTFKADPFLGAACNFWFNILLDISYGKQVLIFFMNLFFNKVFWNETKIMFKKNAVGNSSFTHHATIA